MYTQTNLTQLAQRISRGLSDHGFRSSRLLLGLFLLVALAFRPAYSALLNVNVPLWTQTTGQVNNDALLDVAVDSAGNSVTTGYFHGTGMDFGGEFLNSAQKDIFIVKRDNLGAPSWAKSMGGPDIDEGRGIVADSAENVYVTGNFRQTATFGNTSRSSAGRDDVFVTKLNGNGDFIWTWNAGGTEIEQGWDVAVDSASNVYATGFFSGTVNFGATSLFTSTQKTNDIFVVSLNSDGTLKWANYVAGDSNDRGDSVAVDSTRGFVYVAGFIQGDANFNPTGTGSAFSANPAARDVTLSKYNSATGAHIQTIVLGDVGSRDFGTSVVVDEATGLVYLTGAFDGTADFNPATGNALIGQGTSDVFVAAYNDGLQHQWSVSFGGAGEDVGEDIALGSNGNVYVTGRFEGTADFDPGTAVFERTSAGDEDIFVIALSSSGEFVSVATVGGPLEDRGLGIGVDASQTIYYGGYFNGTANLDPTGVSSAVSSAGGEDIVFGALGSNFSPSATAQNLSTDEDSTLEIILSGADSSGGPITFSLDKGPSNGTLGEISPTAGITTAVSYTPAANFFGQDSFTFLVTDGNSVSASAVVSITVSAINDAPTADASLMYSGNEDEALFVPAPGLLGGTTMDVDGDTLTASADGGTTTKGLALAVQADGSFTVDPTANEAAQALKAGETMTDTFDFTVSDPAGATAQATVQLTLEGRNDAPVAVDDEGFRTAQNTPLNGTISVLDNDRDVDGDILSVDGTPVTLPLSGSVVLQSDGTFVYTPNAGFSGSDSFEYKLLDGNSGEDVGLVSITVLGAGNNAPTASDSSAEVNEDTVLEGASLLSLASDPEGDPLVVDTTPFVVAAHGTVLIREDGTYQYTPAANFNGTDSFQYRVCDDGTPAACTTATVSITVVAVNDPPTATDDTAQGAAGPIIIDVIANDSSLPEMGETLTISAIGEPDQGGLAAITPDGKISYIPPAGFTGVVTFTYTIVDGNGAEATATVTVTVGETPGGTENGDKIYLPILQS